MTISKRNLIQYLDREYEKWDRISDDLAVRAATLQDISQHDAAKISIEGLKATSRSHMLGVLIRELSTWDQDSIGTELDLEIPSKEVMMADIRENIKKIGKIAGMEDEQADDWADQMLERVENVVTSGCLVSK